MPDEPKDDKENSPKNLYAYSLGFSIPAAMGILTYLGYRIDQKWGGGILWTLVGMFLGLFYCLYEIWKLVKKSSDTKNDIS